MDSFIAAGKDANRELKRVLHEREGKNLVGNVGVEIGRAPCRERV